MRRRALLATLGSSMAVSTAGCLDTVADSFDEPIRLARLAALNFDSRAHRFDLRVDRDGEPVHRSSHQIRGRQTSGCTAKKRPARGVRRPARTR